jgi:hypothetical protein
MTIEFAAVSIGILLIVGGALIWKKLRAGHIALAGRMDLFLVTLRLRRPPLGRGDLCTLHNHRGPG